MNGAVTVSPMVTEGDFGEGVRFLVVLEVTIVVTDPVFFLMLGALGQVARSPSGVAIVIGALTESELIPII